MFPVRNAADKIRHDFLDDFFLILKKLKQVIMKASLKTRAAELCNAVNQNVDELMKQLDQERRYHKAVVSALLGCFYKAVPEYLRTAGVAKKICDFLILNYQFGINSTNEKDLSRQAITGWTALADEGHSLSLFNLGVCFQTGFGVEQDPVSAAEIFENSADLGCKFGKIRFAECLKDGYGVAKNEEEAAECFMAVSREFGGYQSRLEISELLWKCKDVEKRREALWLLMHNAFDGHMVSRQKFVEYLSIDQRARDVDIPEICQELKRQATNGNAEAQFLYGICLLNGKVAPEDLSFLKKTQEKAEPHNSDGNVVDEATHEQEKSSAASALAVKMFEAAALQGHTEARYRYWLCWRDRVSDEANESLAQDFLIGAKNDGHVLALGDWAISLKRKSKNPDKQTKETILQALTQAGGCGYVEAQYECGMCLLEGFGCAKNSWGAAFHFQQAAEAGHIGGKYQYAKKLLRSKYCKKDRHMAQRILAYLREAAEAGHVEAQYEYALCLEEERWGIKDVPLAMCYYQAAAEAGHVAASKKLLRSSPSP